MRGSAWPDTWTHRVPLSQSIRTLLSCPGQPCTCPALWTGAAACGAATRRVSAHWAAEPGCCGTGLTAPPSAWRWSGRVASSRRRGSSCRSASRASSSRRSSCSTRCPVNRSPPHYPHPSLAFSFPTLNVLPQPGACLASSLPEQYFCVSYFLPFPGTLAFLIPTRLSYPLSLPLSQSLLPRSRRSWPRSP